MWSGDYKQNPINEKKDDKDKTGPEWIIHIKNDQ